MLIRHNFFSVFSCLNRHPSSSQVVGEVSSLVRRAKRSQSWGDVFTMAELADYIRRRVSDLTGRRRQAWIENRVQGRTYFFEEFESLVDELLSRLNSLSSSLHPPLPPNGHHYREQDGPVLRQEPSDMDVQDCVRTRKTEVAMMNNQTDAGGHGETLLGSHLLRSKLELEILQRGQRGEHSSSVVVWDASQQQDTTAKENLKGRELQTYLKAQNHLPLPESTSRIRTENTPEKPVNEWTQLNEICCLTKTQSTHTEVVVEVLVHQEPGSVKPDQQQGPYADCNS
ncbi:Polycystic kidney disease 1 like 1 [Liparis tanakae]|uniref:Polycystic kidney disease 1 like 1 n=1 Tax=Liparis tanakae TaxID=230148 RepID=A0A4Z2H1Z4_9TELE|nr:Polycystic kidney disease 1 like 1 [Liparis tanakae]